MFHHNLCTLCEIEIYRSIRYGVQNKRLEDEDPLNFARANHSGQTRCYIGNRDETPSGFVLFVHFHLTLICYFIFFNC